MTGPSCLRSPSGRVSRFGTGLDPYRPFRRVSFSEFNSDFLLIFILNRSTFPRSLSQSPSLLSCPSLGLHSDLSRKRFLSFFSLLALGSPPFSIDLFSDPTLSRSEPSLLWPDPSTSKDSPTTLPSLQSSLYRLSTKSLRKDPDRSSYDLPIPETVPRDPYDG